MVRMLGLVENPAGFWKKTSVVKQKLELDVLMKLRLTRLFVFFALAAAVLFASVGLFRLYKP